MLSTFLTWRETLISSNSCLHSGQTESRASHWFKHGRQIRPSQSLQDAKSSNTFVQIGQTNCCRTFLNSGLALSMVNFFSSSADWASRNYFSTDYTKVAVHWSALAASTGISSYPLSSSCNMGSGMFSSSSCYGASTIIPLYCLLLNLCVAKSGALTWNNFNMLIKTINIYY